MFFTGSNAKDKKNQLVIALVAVGMLVIGWRFIWLDIKTSGLFYDSLGMQIVQKGNSPIVAGISLEALFVGCFLSLSQIYFSYRAALSKGTISFLGGEFSEKRFWVLALLTLATVDTFTDVDYRSFGLDTWELTLKTTMVSLVVYNLGSEWALGTGFRELVQNFAAAIGVLGLILHELMDNARFLAGQVSAKIESGKPAGPPAPPKPPQMQTPPGMPANMQMPPPGFQPHPRNGGQQFRPAPKK